MTLRDVVSWIYKIFHCVVWNDLIICSIRMTRDPHGRSVPQKAVKDLVLKYDLEQPRKISEAKEYRKTCLRRRTLISGIYELIWMVGTKGGSLGNPKVLYHRRLRQLRQLACAGETITGFTHRRGDGIESKLNRSDFRCVVPWKRRSSSLCPSDGTVGQQGLVLFH